MMVRLDGEKTRAFADAILQKVGLSQKDAFTVADSLIFANLRGIDSHGILRLPFYVKRIEEGGTKAKPNITVAAESPASALLDGDNGMGQVVGMHGTELAIQKARQMGACFVGARHSSHFGAAGYFAAKMTEANMIGFSMSNCTPVMAAWGGSTSMIGNNPLAIAVPYREDMPIILDIAMSRVAGGKVRLAAKNNQEIPTGWIVDRHGRNTSDPNNLVDGGALLPFGEHKGFALAVMMEILSGVLTGSGMLEQIPFWQKDLRTPLNIGHSFVAISIEHLFDLNTFRERLEWMMNKIKSSPLGEDSEGIFVPGEIETKTEKERAMTGIPISQEVWKDLQQLSEDYRQPLEDVTFN